jgi:hypothetical protein
MRTSLGDYTPHPNQSRWPLDAVCPGDALVDLVPKEGLSADLGPNRRPTGRKSRRPQAATKNDHSFGPVLSTLSGVVFSLIFSV